MPFYATLGQNLIRIFLPYTIYLKMQPNALLIWQNFIIAKNGVTNLPHLKGSSPSRFKNCSETTRGNVL
jgi:hypothetical protein